MTKLGEPAKVGGDSGLGGIGSGAVSCIPELSVLLSLSSVSENISGIVFSFVSFSFSSSVSSSIKHTDVVCFSVDALFLVAL